MTSSRRKPYLPNCLFLRRFFLTNDNRFVERAEAAEIAFKSGQIKIEKTYLFSEDVW